MKYTHILFDVDGTLIDTEEAVLRSLRDVVLEIRKHDIKIDDLRFALGITSDNALQRLGIMNIEYGNVLWQKFYLNYSDTIKVFHGIHEALEELTKSCTLGILTSKTNAEYQNDFVPFGLANYFEIVVCADDTVNHKPHSEPMIKYLELTKANSESVLYVGDTIHDMKCALGANVDFALALWGCKNPKDISAKHYLSKPYEILSLL